MSQISTSNALGAALTPPTSVNRFGEMTSEDFVRIIFTELANQDPFQPNDTGALLEQLDSIRGIESNVKLEKQLDNLVTENQLASAGNLLGKFVEGLDQNTQRAEGFAIAVSRERDEIILELDTGQRISFENVSSVIDLSVFAPLPPIETSTEPTDTNG